MTILVVSSLGIISAMRQSTIRGEAFTSERFTAMFLSQKLLEHINSRIAEDPYFFSQLVASATGDPNRVVEGDSFYFRLIENTRDFSFLDPVEDGPITEEWGALHKQLEGFSCQVEAHFVPVPGTSEVYKGLMEIRTKIFWKDRAGIDKEYVQSQFVHGTDLSTFRTIDPADFEPFSDEEAAEALWVWLAEDDDSIPDNPTIANFISFNGGGVTQTVKAVGELSFLLLIYQDMIELYDEKIEDARIRRDSAMASPYPANRVRGALLQERIAQLNEQLASILFNMVARTLPALARLKSYPLDRPSLGDRIDDARTELRATCMLGIDLLTAISIRFSAAEDAYMKLLEEPYRSSFPKRRVTAVLRKIFELQKLAVVSSMATGRAEAALARLRNHLGTTLNFYRGKEPFFVDYLKTESSRSSSVNSVFETYGGSPGLSGLINRVFNAREDFQTIASRL